jgi:type III pantothenate kinase
MAVDVGNTNLKIGIYTGKRLDHFWRLATDREMTAEELGVSLNQLFTLNEFDPRTVQGIVVSSVVPPLTTAIRELCEKEYGIKPLIVGSGVRTGMKIATDHPAQVGADRIVSAVAAVKLYGAPAIVVGLGTAITVSVVNERHEFIGGAIAPGGFISAEALFSQAAQLPTVNLSSTERHITQDTISSMTYGIVYGIAGQVDGIVARMQDELKQPFTVVATGGMSELVAPHSTTIQHVRPELVWELNS